MEVEKQEVKQKPVSKLNWRLEAALRQMLRRRQDLIDKRAVLTAEIEKLDAAILALE